MRRPRLTSLLTAAVSALIPALAGAIVLAPRARAGDEAEAKEILRTAGVEAGLCIHLGCGASSSAGLTAELAAASPMLVHGVALDDESLARSRSAIESRGMCGRAMVERLDNGPLPYLRDLARLAVVEDLKGLSDRGITKEEILRVVAPGGVLCVREGGKWTKTVKPWPKEMDEWTHPRHGADGNPVSTDAVLDLPLGFRWLDGLPVNLRGFSATRSWVLAGGRCFALGINEYENIGPPRGDSSEQYLSARDAFSGLQLWKLPTGLTNDGGDVSWTNTGPLATDGARVYSARKESVIIVDAASGKVEASCATKHDPRKLVLSDGLIVATCWEKPEKSKWFLWMPATEAGTVEAFDAKTGAPKWKLPYCAYEMVAAGGMLYMIVQSGVLPTEQRVVAVDLAAGNQLWSAPRTNLGEKCDIALMCAGPGFVVVSKPEEKKTFALAAADGRELWHLATGGNYIPMVEGLVWGGGKKLDPLTGEDKGSMPTWISGHGCQMSKLAGLFQISSYGVSEMPNGGKKKEELKSFSPTGVRPSCVEGFVPAYGMLYSPQNNCRCKPGAVYGFAALGPSGERPSVEEFARARPVEKGPAFGKADPAAAGGSGDWPTCRGSAERSAFTPGELPAKAREMWKVNVVKLADGPLAAAWKAQLGSPLSAPVAAAGRVYLAATDEGRVVALDAKTGAKAWSVALASRIDSPPTIHAGLCLVGCHDGWVYALRATDGVLAWRTRLAPRESRMVAFGQVESVWPAVGSVLISGGVAYATAGRTSESDGGVAIAALEPATGKTLWAKSVGAGIHRLNDVLSMRDGKLKWMFYLLEPASGEPVAGQEVHDLKYYGGGGKPFERPMLDGTWTLMPGRRSGAFEVDKAKGDLLAWSAEVAVGPKSAVERQTGEERWKAPSASGCQVEAIALAGGTAVLAGRVRGAKPDADIGFLWLVSLAEGKRIFETALESPPSYDGLAVAGGRLYVSLRSGAVVCFGE